MQTKTIQQIKEMLNDEHVNESVLAMLEHDERKGVQRLVASYKRKMRQRHEQMEAFQQKLAFDYQFKRHERDLIAGVDEAGRGPLAGPVVAAAVILPDDFRCYDLNDSKQISVDKRLELYERIKEEAISYSIKSIPATKIDEWNILEATKRAMELSVGSLHIQPDVVLIDAVHIEKCTPEQHAIIKGDAKSIAIAAASILAKVSRDKTMQQLHEQFPMYGFHRHMGYGTKEHIEAIKTYGVTEHHRLSFAPVQKNA